VSSGPKPNASLAEQIVRAHSDITPRSSGALSTSGVSEHGVCTDLSVDEWLLIDEAGYEPCGLVAGASVFHIGVVGVRSGNCEIESLTTALLEAREHATATLRDEAERLGALGVVGVRLTIEAMGGKSHLARVIAIGTGIRPKERLPDQSSKAQPFLTALSGQEFYVLSKGGYLPLALVMGACVYHVGRQGGPAWVKNKFRNLELSSYSSALYEARELAMARLQGEAHAAKAQGVVGVTTSEISHVWGSHVIEFFAMGTAVRSLTGEHRSLGPRLALSVIDPVVLTDPAALIGNAKRCNQSQLVSETGLDAR
jgi:uncharacterized protein YbjQ (UPF0145 family)